MGDGWSRRSTATSAGITSHSGSMTFPPPPPGWRSGAASRWTPSRSTPGRWRARPTSTSRILSGCSPNPSTSREGDMATTKSNPSELYDSTPFGFSHAAVQDGGRVLHLAGQVAWDADCNVVGVGDFAAQVDKALANIAAVLAHSGLGPSDVVRLR